MNVLFYVLQGVLAVICIALIALVLLQQGKSAGLGTIAGGAETFFGKQKGRSMEKRLESFTRFAALGFIVLCIGMVVLQRVAQL